MEGCRVRLSANPNTPKKRLTPTQTTIMNTIEEKPLTLAEKVNAFRDAIDGKRVELTVSEVSTLCDSFTATTHNEAVKIILEELGWS